MTLTLLRLLSYGVVVVLLGLGFLTLPLTFCGMMVNLNNSLEGFPIVVRVVGLFLPLWTLVYPLLSLLLPFLKDLIHATWALSHPRF
jgi:O-antigen ligase